MICFLKAVPSAAADIEPVKGNMVIFTVPQQSLQLSTLSERSAHSVAEVLNRIGRFLPVEYNRFKWAMDSVTMGKNENLYEKLAKKLDVDLYIIISLGREMNVLFGTIKIIPLKEEFRHLQSDITVRSMIPLNIPLKLSRVVAKLFSDTDLTAEITGRADGNYLMAAGQWHGLSVGTYQLTDGGSVRIINAGRYRSVVQLSESEGEKQSITIRLKPDTKGIIREIDRKIEHNISYKYQLQYTTLKGLDSKKKMAESLLVINLGAHLFLSGYGSYLSTSYLGFKKTTPSIPGIVLSTALYLTHFTLPDFMTKFKINFFPWVMDSDKTIQLRNLQIFLWATIPVTASVSFLDQLAFQLANEKLLPPFFLHKNEAALAFSVIIPGGGLFYKGHRLAGWGFYLSEMFLAGFSVYTKDEKKKALYSSITLGGVKLVELITAYFVKPSYNFYEFETEGAIGRNSFYFNFEESEIGDGVFKLGIAMQF